MPLAATPSTTIETLGDLLSGLGGISPARVRFRPFPGTATEQDVTEIEERENRVFELIDGVLVEKAMGFKESMIAIAVAAALRSFVVPRKLGYVSGSDGTIKLSPGPVRIPGVAFIPRQRMPGGKVPDEPIPQLVPDLAVVVLSAGNTRAEMDRKRREYFEAGVRLVWVIDLPTRSCTVYHSPNESHVVKEGESLDGGDVLPS